MSLSFSMRITPAPEAMFKTVGEESVLMNLKTQLYLGADAVGTRMWIALTQSPSIQAAYDSLLEEFDVETEKLRRDLEDFLQRLLEYGLIEIQPGRDGEVENSA